MATPRQVPDDLWAEIVQLLPAPPARHKGGRSRADDRRLLDGMLYVLWTGCPWRAMPIQFGPWQTVYDRFVEWRKAEVVEQIWARCLELYDAAQDIEGEWQSGDGTYVRAPLGKRMRPQSYRSG